MRTVSYDHDTIHNYVGAYSIFFSSYGRDLGLEAKGQGEKGSCRCTLRRSPLSMGRWYLVLHEEIGVPPESVRTDSACSEYTARELVATVRILASN